MVDVVIIIDGMITVSDGSGPLLLGKCYWKTLITARIVIHFKWLCLCVAKRFHIPLKHCRVKNAVQQYKCVENSSNVLKRLNSTWTTQSPHELVSLSTNWLVFVNGKTSSEQTKFPIRSKSVCVKTNKIFKANR